MYSVLRTVPGEPLNSPILIQPRRLAAPRRGDTNGFKTDKEKLEEWRNHRWSRSLLNDLLESLVKALDSIRTVIQDSTPSTSRSDVFHGIKTHEGRRQAPQLEREGVQISNFFGVS